MNSLGYVLAIASLTALALPNVGNARTALASGSDNPLVQLPGSGLHASVPPVSPPPRPAPPPRPTLKPQPHKPPPPPHR